MVKFLIRLSAYIDLIHLRWLEKDLLRQRRAEQLRGQWKVVRTIEQRLAEIRGNIWSAEATLAGIGLALTITHK
jgi:hypothetical protein